MPTLSLDGPWTFRISGHRTPTAPPDPSLWQPMPAVVPGTVHHHLHALGKISDPHYARNELDLQWIDEQDWEWTRTFDAGESDAARARQELIFSGLDTVATIFLNGQRVGRSANMFRQVVCDVRGVLRPASNELRVLLESPTSYAKAQAQRGKHRVADGDWKWQTGEVRLTHRAWIRKVQCHFGWDWGLYLATSGIWQSCRLECADGPRIASMSIEQVHSRRAVKLNVRLHLMASVKSSGTVRLTCRRGDLEIDAVELRAAGRAGEHVLEAALVIKDRQLWWPAGEGAQPLYDITAQWLTSATEPSLSRRIGLRTVELVTKKGKSPDGQPAESFYFKINGRPIFAKGANWIPPDQFVDRCTPDVYRHLLTSMVQANMNMVRVWGGGWYEQDIFYRLCDELGLMVWQDFMMACALYPDTTQFIKELTEEAIYQIRRLHAHPSIVLWNGDNEDAEAVWRWWRDSPDFKKNVRIYKKVMTALKRTVEREDPTRRFWLSSPSNDDFNGDCTNPNRGDVHYWTVWHGRQPFSNYYTVKPRFASEFGFQSFAEPRTIRAVVPAEELNPSSRIMEHHQRSPDGNMLITNTMAREMRIPRDFDTFCWASQINQAMAIRTAVEHWRRLRPWCMGTIYWQLNDLWPVASWSSIDYHGRWKVLHHWAKRFYAPVLGSIIVKDGNSIDLWATSDLPRPIELEATLSMYTWAGEPIGQPERFGVKLRAGQSKWFGSFTEMKIKSHEICLFLHLRGDGVSHDNHAALVPWKWVTLPQPLVSQEVRESGAGVELVVSSDQVVPFFHAELDGMDGHFDGDWAVMEPRKQYVMRWVPHLERGTAMPSLAAARRALKTMSLYDTYAHE
jgi:beta-mannosidase